MSDEAFKLDTKNLDGLLKAMKKDLSRAQIGILGGKTIRDGNEIVGGKNVRAGRSVNAANKPPKTAGNGEAVTNASIGAMHEFGMGNMPQRSFLRIPISQNLARELENSGAFTPEAAKQVIKQASMVPWLESAAAVALKIVSDAFDTGGFGKWPKWKTKGYKNNANMILVDTQQLRNSITSEVKE